MSSSNEKPKIEIFPVGSKFPVVDIVKLKDCPNVYQMHAELVGYKKEDVTVQVEKSRTISISGNRTDVTPVDGILLCERSCGKFERTFEIPFRIDTTTVNAKFEGGLLLINFQKYKEEYKEIPIG